MYQLSDLTLDELKELHDKVIEELDKKTVIPYGIRKGQCHVFIIKSDKLDNYKYEIQHIFNVFGYNNLKSICRLSDNEMEYIFEYINRNDIEIKDDIKNMTEYLNEKLFL